MKVGYVTPTIVMLNVLLGEYFCHLTKPCGSIGIIYQKIHNARIGAPLQEGAKIE